MSTYKKINPEQAAALYAAGVPVEVGIKVKDYPRFGYTEKVVWWKVSTMLSYVNVDDGWSTSTYRVLVE